MVNAKHHYAETHCKEVVAAFKQKGRLRLNDLPDTFWSEHNAIEDLGEKDPKFPKDEYIKALLKAESKAPEALQESSTIEKEEVNAAVRSIQEWGSPFAKIFYEVLQATNFYQSFKE